MLVTGHDPLRAYLHTNGLVLFSTHEYSNDSWATETGGVALGHVTNYAQVRGAMGTSWACCLVCTVRKVWVPASALNVLGGASCRSFLSLLQRPWPCYETHVTPACAQNMDGMVWDMEQLKDHMGGSMRMHGRVRLLGRFTSLTSCL